MGSAVWTIGHSNHSLERFVELLRSHEIDFAIDVRSYPYSRYAPHFDREALEATLPRNGLRYLFLGDSLGGRPTDEDHYDDDGHALYGEMAEQPGFRAAIERVCQGAEDHRLALFCSCRKPTECHRRLLVGRVLTDHGITLHHVMPDGSVEDEREVQLPDDDGQTNLFGEDQATWRSTQSVSHRRRLSTSSTG